MHSFDFNFLHFFYQFYLIQIPTEKSIADYDSIDADPEKQNPYHGMLTLTIQSRGVDSHTSVSLRGPGRPPLNDVPLDDIPEMEDPVNIFPMK